MPSAPSPDSKRRRVVLTSRASSDLPSLKTAADRYGPELVKWVTAGTALFLILALGASLQRSFWYSPSVVHDCHSLI